MTDIKRLSAIIKESGYKRTFLAKKLGLSYQGFLNKLEGISEFKSSEIRMLCDLLSIDNPKDVQDIFLPVK